MVNVILVTDPDKGIQKILTAIITPSGSAGTPLPEIWNLMRMPSLPWDGPCIRLGRILCVALLIEALSLNWALCVPAQASTLLGLVELRWLDKHTLPVTASSCMQLDAQPGSWSWLWSSELQDYGAIGCGVRQSSVHIRSLLLKNMKPRQLAEYLPPPISSPRSRNNNTLYQICSGT